MFFECSNLFTNQEINQRIKSQFVWRTLCLEWTKSFVYSLYIIQCNSLNKVRVSLLQTPDRQSFRQWIQLSYHIHLVLTNYNLSSLSRDLVNGQDGLELEQKMHLNILIDFRKVYYILILQNYDQNLQYCWSLPVI